MIANPSLRSYGSMGARMRVGVFRRKWLPGPLVVFVVAMVTGYLGTNPNHRFTVQWGQCHKLQEQGALVNQITLSLLDNQYLDQARKSSLSAGDRP